MKHSSVLILGLATLALSSAPTYAKEPLNFDLPLSSRSSDRSIAHPSYTIASQPTDRARKPNAETPAIAQSESLEPATKLPNLPLFELPPFQLDSSSDPSSDSSVDSSNQSNGVSSDSKSAGNSQNDNTRTDFQPLTPRSSNSYSSPKPSISEPSDERSPFTLPDEFSDADLFESDPLQKRETNSANSDSLLPELPSPDSKEDSREDSRLPDLPSEDSRSPDSLWQDDSELEFETSPDVPDAPSVERFESNQRNDRSRELSDEPENEDNSSPLAKIDSSNNSSNNSSGYSSKNKSIGLDFNPPVRSYASSAIPKSDPSPILTESPNLSQPEIAVDKTSLDHLFKGDSDSLVAVAVGSAEGTRTPDGGKNPAYQGHTDPGNGVWNLGSFSYQHGASSPEEADAKQLARLRTQAQSILDMAAAKGLDLTLEEKLNGIDLANQAPKAALDEYGGYIDWLAEARTSGLGGTDAILWARVHSFLDPHTKTWNAPGLGNSEDRITSDQERRMLAIAKAIATYMQDLANRPPAKAADEQASRPVSTENQSVGWLFTQKAMRLFEYSVDEKYAEASEPELPIVQQILDLDLSGLTAA